MICIARVRLKDVIVKVDEIVKLNKLIKTIMRLVLVFLNEVGVSLFDWGVDFVCDVIKTRSIEILSNQ